MQLFASVFFEEALAFVPGCTFKVEAVNPDTFSWVHKVFAINSGVIGNQNVARSCYIDLLLYCVKGPVVCSVGSGDLLADTSQESLSIGESGQPVGDGSLFHEPVVEQVVTLYHGTKPSGKSWVQPRNLSSRRIGQEELRYP